MVNQLNKNLDYLEKQGRILEVEEIMSCPVTGKDIIAVLYDGEEIPLESYGECSCCHICYSKEALAKLDRQSSSWAVVYEGPGVWCKECYALPPDTETIYEKL